jgi:phosphopantothenoylcysteine decarboxylase/phosphopantothenate--cysteine ligase
VSLPTPTGVTRIDVRSAAQMHAGARRLPADVASAPPPWPTSPRAASAGKIKKQAGMDTLTLELVRTPDILAEVAAHHCGRGWWSDSRRKPTTSSSAARQAGAQALDLIAANQVGASAAAASKATTTRWWCTAVTASSALGPGAKTALANNLLAIISARLE